MESINILKGYGKVANPPPNHRRRRIIAVSLTIFLTLIIGSLIAALIHDSITESDDQESPQLASNSAESLKTVCAVTRYPDSCFSSISPLNSPPSNSPLRFLNLSLHVSMVEVSSLKSAVAEPESEPAMRDCAELFDDAASQLRRSAELEKGLTEMKISDLQTWISAAMTDQETCLDGLEEMGSTAVGEFKLRVQKSQEYMSNTLAILNNIKSLFKKFGLTMP